MLLAEHRPLNHYSILIYIPSPPLYAGKQPPAVRPPPGPIIFLWFSFTLGTLSAPSCRFNLYEFHMGAPGRLLGFLRIILTTPWRLLGSLGTLFGFPLAPPGLPLPLFGFPFGAFCAPCSIFGMPWPLFGAHMDVCLQLSLFTVCSLAEIGVTNSYSFKQKHIESRLQLSLFTVCSLAEIGACDMYCSFLLLKCSSSTGVQECICLFGVIDCMLQGGQMTFM